MVAGSEEQASWENQVSVHGIFYVLTLKVIGHFYTLEFKAVLKFQPVAKGSDIDSSSRWGSGKVLEEYMEQDDIIGPIFRKYDLLHQVKNDCIRN